MVLLRRKSRGKKLALLGQFRRSPSWWSFPRDQSSVHVYQKLHGPKSTLRHHRPCGEVGAPAHGTYRYLRPSIIKWAYVGCTHNVQRESCGIFFSLPRAPGIKFVGKWWQWSVMSISTKHTNPPRQRARDYEDKMFLRRDHYNLIFLVDVCVYVYHYSLIAVTTWCGFSQELIPGSLEDRSTMVRWIKGI